MSNTATAATTAAPRSSSDVAARVRDLVSYVQGGRIIDAMYEFYADDVRMQENNNPPTAGLAANVEREKQFLAYVKQWKAVEIDAVAVDAARGRTVVQSRLEFEAVDGKTVKMDQVAVQTWRDGKIVHEKFYYDTGAAAAAAAKN
jgi:ketosteroid isomerase-like protein